MILEQMHGSKLDIWLPVECTMFLIIIVSARCIKITLYTELNNYVILIKQHFINIITTQNMSFIKITFPQCLIQ